MDMEKTVPEFGSFNEFHRTVYHVIALFAIPWAMNGDEQKRVQPLELRDTLHH